MDSCKDNHWIDITSLVKNATNSLPSGQMIRNQNFTLFDSMAALEIMSPKMDTGYVEPGSKNQIIPIETQISIDQAIFILDEILIIEAMFYNGVSLPQTLYSCLYYSYESSAEKDIINRILNVFTSKSGCSNLFRDLVIYPIIIGTAKCVKFFYEELHNQNIFSEEDFSLNYYHKNYWNEINIGQALNILNLSIDYFLSNRESILLHIFSQDSKNLLNSYDSSKPHLSEDSYQIEKNMKMMDHLLVHLKLKRDWLSSLNDLQYKKLSPTVFFLSDAVSLLNSVSEKLNSLIDYSSKRIFPNNFPRDFVFDVNFIRKLSVDSPSKKTEYLQLDEALHLFKDLVSELLLVPEVLSFSSYKQLDCFSHCFSVRTPAPFAFSRSLIQSILFHDSKFLTMYPLSRFVKSQISTVVGSLPFSVIDIYHHNSKNMNSKFLKNSTQLSLIKDSIENFVSQAYVPLSNVIKSYYQNGPRQRRVQSQLIYDLDYLQYTAESLDAHIHEFIGNDGCFYDSLVDPTTKIPNIYIFSNFVFFTKVSLIKYILILGFPLNIYQYYEFSSIYWYLNKTLQIHSSIANRISDISKTLDPITSSIEPSHENPSIFSKLNNKSFNTQMNENFPQIFNPILQIDLQVAFIEAYRLMSSGQYFLFQSLAILGLVANPWDSFIYRNSDSLISLLSKCKNENVSQSKDSVKNYPLDPLLVNAAENCINISKQNSFQNQKARYNIRFRNFGQLKSPEFPTFEEFSEANEGELASCKVKDLLLLSQNNFNNSIKIMDSLKLRLTNISNDSELSMIFDPSTFHNFAKNMSQKNGSPNGLNSTPVFKSADQYYLEDMGSLKRVCLTNSLLCLKILNNKGLKSSKSKFLEIKCSAFKRNFENLTSLITKVYQFKLNQSPKIKKFKEPSNYSKELNNVLSNKLESKLMDYYDHYQFNHLFLFWSDFKKTITDQISIDIEYKYCQLWPNVVFKPN
ncbi:N-alpha-acetyltransferase 35, NatC auxiliary subunit [Smittium mucronatum]|uniref:N-alpha-acetyltransferase 35, NatC auxiliary subunit n=1 Tax=Smittium mucronatum TaxID=133383 RepID=A0A1R0H185_9FUNG|nr:N-alpha-acetyltransferase 35, NatC auxiliary subunit [Smittium mucronatum]